MSEQIKLMVMSCPICGANLKAENTTSKIKCLSCDNDIFPVIDSPKRDGFSVSGPLRIEGIKTPASALAHIEIFFDEYDWDAFTYAQSLSIDHIDKLNASLKNTSADDKNTWFVNFQSTFVPYLKKIEGCSKIMESIISCYKEDSLDSYSYFDAYKRIVAEIENSRETVLDNLRKAISYAAKYGATPEELNNLNADVEVAANLAIPTRYDSVEQIPQIRQMIEQRNAEILAELAAAGINAQASYARAIDLINGKQYVSALNVLLNLRGYADSSKLAKQLDRYYKIFSVLEICGRLYHYKDESDGTGTESFSLYPTEQGKICAKPVIKHISRVITNHADILYYVHTDNSLRSYHFSTGEKKTLFSEGFSDQFLLHNRKVYFMGYDAHTNRIHVLNIATGTVEALPEAVMELVEFGNGRIVYTTVDDQGQIDTCIRNLRTGSVTVIPGAGLRICGYTGNRVVFTVDHPNDDNQNLFIKELDNSMPPRQLEGNILSFCEILSDKLFYYVGCPGNRSMISLNPDGSGRKEMPSCISNLLFAQGGWIYFIRRAYHNSILCRSRIDGSEMQVIAPDIDQYIKLKNGYLYYLDGDSSLVKVRMDGSNLQELCDHVEQVLSVKEERIVFLSYDGNGVKSIYAVDFDGSGRRKLVYNVMRARDYDEDTVYFVAAQQRPDSSYGGEESSQLETLFRLNVNTGLIEKLLDIEIEQKKEGCSGFAFSLVLAVLGYFMFFAGISAESEEATFIGLLIGVIFTLLAITCRKKD